MALLTAAALEGIRDTVGLLFSDEIVRRRFTTTTDEYGNEERDTAEDVTYPGRLIWRETTERTDSGQASAVLPSVLLPHDADVETTDQIIADGLTFEAAGPPMLNPSPGESTHLRVLLRHVSG